MKVLNVINNNVVSSLDEKKREIIVMGKGIGFKKKSGDLIPEPLIEKVFRLPDDTQDKFTTLIQGISYTHMKLASDIIDYASVHVGRKLRKTIYVTLTDHLDFAIQREKEGMVFSNAILWEIKMYYKKEYEVGKMAQKMVYEREGIRLSDDEVGFITMHIINAEEGHELDSSQTFLTMVKNILDIIHDSLDIDIEEDTISYERFLTHLKFFLRRAIKKEYHDTDDIIDVYGGFLDKNPQEFECANKIKSYIKEKLDYETSEDEMVYLTMHLYRLHRS